MFPVGSNIANICKCCKKIIKVQFSMFASKTVCEGVSSSLSLRRKEQIVLDFIIHSYARSCESMNECKLLTGIGTASLALMLVKTPNIKFGG